MLFQKRLIRMADFYFFSVVGEEQNFPSLCPRIPLYCQWDDNKRQRQSSFPNDSGREMGCGVIWLKADESVVIMQVCFVNQILPECCEKHCANIQNQSY